MNTNKKAQSLSINTIIIAVLGIAVMVILFAVMTGKLAIFSSAASECPGRCVSTENKFRGLERPGVLDVTIITPLSTDETSGKCGDGERRVYGAYIASGVRYVSDSAEQNGVREPRQGENGRGVPCNLCCATA